MFLKPSLSQPPAGDARPLGNHDAPAQDVEIAPGNGPFAPSPAEALAARLIEAQVARILSDPAQPRKTFDPLVIRALADNIARNDLLHPIHVRPAADDMLMVLTGAYRLEAFKLLGRSTIPAFLHSGPLDPRQHRLIQISENLLSEDVNPVEQALAFQECLNGGTASRLAAELGVSVSTISRPLQLLARLPADLQELIRNGRLGGAAARVLCGLHPDADKQRAFAQMYLAGTVTSAAQLAAAVKDAKRGAGQAAAPQSFAIDHGGIKVVITVPPGLGSGSAEAAARHLAKELKEHAGPGWPYFKAYLDKKAQAKAAEAKLRQAQATLDAHDSHSETEVSHVTAKQVNAHAVSPPVSNPPPQGGPS